MIGVVASAGQRPVIREFFNLFKTPWEFCRPGLTYEVIICSDAQLVTNPARLVLVYGARPGPFDSAMGIAAVALRGAATLSHGKNRIPLQGDCLSLAGQGKAVLLAVGHEIVGLELDSTVPAFVRLGFDLFGETERLLRKGQPMEHARIPTLELQIAILRDLIVAHSIPLFEIPPVPAGYKFIACLTHDVDHPRIRNHRWDHTMFGFLYRAIIGSIVDFSKGRRSFRQCATNWMAAFSLPLVYLGYAKDFWKTVGRYREIEGKFPSTFFVIPQRNNPGRDAGGDAPSRRAAHYGIEDFQGEIRRIVAEGCEVGLHGIDAWHDVARGRAELAALRSVAGVSEIGVRMHWLYFDEDSPALLEQAGFSYDSTVGYNETVGFRAGTLQAYKPLEVDRLLELPMQIMDTALFFSSHLNLSPARALTILDEMVEQASRFGGALTINWHDRSVAPERQWDATYIDLLHDLKSKGAWFATCAQTISWFNQRRTAVLEEVNETQIKVTLSSKHDNRPDFLLRLHNARAIGDTSPGNCQQNVRFSDLTLSESKEIAWSHLDSMVTAA